MRVKGFTLVELVVVIILLGIFTAVLLPRFINITDEARVSHAQNSTGAFTEALTSYHAAWLAENKPSTMTIGGKTVTFTNGWPHPTIVNTAACIDLWDTAFTSAEPVQAYVANAPAPAWSSIGFGNSCIYIYHDGEIYSGANPLPLFLYRPVNGSVFVQKFFM